MKLNLKNKNRLFWIANALGWLLYGIAMFFFFGKGKIPDFTTFYLNFITYLTGFVVTSLLRYYLRFIQKKIKSIIVISTVLIITVYAVTIAWYLFDVSLSYPVWNEDQIKFFNKMLTFKGLIKRNYSQFFLLFGWIALYYGIRFWIDFQNEKERKEEALLLAQTAELEMLRYQLNPHFLFNSLNSIRALVDENQKAAKSMITELSEFLRYSLLQKDVKLVPLSRELEAVKHYLSIEKKRFEEKLQIDYNVSDNAEKIKVLSFMLHPLIENAVKHGMKTSKLPLKLLLQSYVKNETLHISVCNSGKWVDDSKEDGTNTGLQNVVKRLRNAYNDNYSFEIVKKEDAVCVHITIKIDNLNE
ncbi:MAG: histidine kinase [Bacteroidales bacterium]|jgi:two-component system LytT family sensor kinase|nr:histidine kinase [Bacteroidales bacterium]